MSLTKRHAESKDYPLGGNVEPYDQWREEEMLREEESSDKKLHNHVLNTLEKAKQALNEYSGYTCCHKCGKEIKKSEANPVPIADSPDDYNMQPFCDRCYEDTMGANPDDYDGSQAQLERDLRLALRDYAEEYGDYNAVIQIMKVIPNLTHIAESIEKSYEQE